MLLRKRAEEGRSRDRLSRDTAPSPKLEPAPSPSLRPAADPSTREAEANANPKLTPLPKEGTGPSSAPRIREYFPETLFFMPELITDEKGHARLTLPPADSITSWRMLASAIARTGALGFEQANLKVFQDFFIDIDFPVALTKGDRVHVPVAVYNYLKEPQTLAVRVEKESWFELSDPDTRSITLKPGEVSVVYFGLRVKEHGRRTFTVFAEGKVQDAVRRSVEVLEKGREMPISQSDRVLGRRTFKVALPDQAIEGATVLFARLTPSVGDLVTGLEGMIRMPYG